MVISGDFQLTRSKLPEFKILQIHGLLPVRSGRPIKTSRLLRTDLNLPPGKPPPTKVPYLYSLIFLVT